MLLNTLLLNETNFTMNGSVNLTVNVIAENLTGHLISETSTFSQVLPIISLIIGSLLTYFLNIRQEYRKEEKEIRRYEYTLIIDILDIAEKEDAQNQMTEYYRKEKRRPSFVKTKNYKIILEFMKRIMDEEAADVENLKTIRDNLKNKI